MSWTAADIPDLAGRMAVVTGANGGLGVETASVLAAKGAHVVMAVRNQAKAADAVARIRRETPGASLELVDLDLGSLASIRAAADAIIAANDKVDILVNNAGVMATPERETADGFELQLGVNHLGHWALTTHLMPRLLAAPARRVVSVTSTAHHMGRPLDPRNPHLHGTYEPVEGLRPVEARQLPLRPRPAAGVRTGRRHRDQPDGAPRAVPHRPAGGHRTRGRCRRERALLALAGGEHRNGSCRRRPAAASRSHRPGRAWWRAVRAALHQQRPAGAPALFRPGADGAIAILWQVSERETAIPMTIAP